MAELIAAIAVCVAALAERLDVLGRRVDKLEAKPRRKAPVPKADGK